MNMALTCQVLGWTDLSSASIDMSPFDTIERVEFSPTVDPPEGFMEVRPDAVIVQ